LEVSPTGGDTNPLRCVNVLCTGRFAVWGTHL